MDCKKALLSQDNISSDAFKRNFARLSSKKVKEFQLTSFKKVEFLTQKMEVFETTDFDRFYMMPQAVEDENPFSRVEQEHEILIFTHPGEIHGIVDNGRINHNFDFDLMFARIQFFKTVIS